MRVLVFVIDVLRSVRSSSIETIHFFARYSEHSIPFDRKVFWMPFSIRSSEEYRGASGYVTNWDKGLLIRLWYSYECSCVPFVIELLLHFWNIFVLQYRICTIWGQKYSIFYKLRIFYYFLNSEFSTIILIIVDIFSNYNIN